MTGITLCIAVRSQNLSQVQLRFERSNPYPMESVMTIKACLIQNRNLAPLSQVNPIVRQLSKYIQSLRVFPCPLEQLSTDTKLGHQTNSKLDPQ